MVKGQRKPNNKKKVDPGEREGSQSISENDQVAKRHSKVNKDEREEDKPKRNSGGSRSSSKSKTNEGKAEFEEGDQIMQMQVGREGEQEFLSDCESEKVTSGQSVAKPGTSREKAQTESTDHSSSEVDMDESESEQETDKSTHHRKEKNYDSQSSSRKSRSKRKKARAKRRKRRCYTSSSDGSTSSSTSGSRSRTRHGSSRARNKKRRRKSKVAQEIEMLSKSVQSMQNAMMTSGLFGSGSQPPSAGRRPREPVTGGNKINSEVVKALPFTCSNTTIYQNLLPERQSEADAETVADEVEDRQVDSEITFKIKKIRGSTSSEDHAGPIDTSDEMLNIDCDKFISECAEEVARARIREPSNEVGDAPGRAPNPFDRGGEMIKEAEIAKKKPVLTTGKGNDIPGVSGLLPACSVNFDEEYMVIGSHVDNALQEKIINFEYVDFAKLIPKDRVTKADDHRFELVVRGGSTYFAPVSERESTSIHNFSRWEQAFRIFSNILTRVYPGKASELIQYNHTIYTAALTFAWDNVYHYDKEFRMHISKFPQRSWSVILQQAWSMCLKDRVGSHHHNDEINKNNGQSNQQKGKRRDICKRFNRGKCTYGQKCKFEHRCEVPKCGKFGHGAHICRLRNGEVGDEPHQKRKEN